MTSASERTSWRTRVGVLGSNSKPWAARAGGRAVGARYALRSLGVALMMTLVGGPAWAQAEDVEAARRSAARDLGIQAADAYDAQDYATALDRFTRAQELYPAPTLALMQARTLSALGRWVEAVEKYNETARAALDSGASDQYQQAVQDAAREGAQLAPLLPRLEIAIGTAQLPSDMTVELDGTAVPAALLNVPHPVDPGAHLLEVRVGGVLKHSEHLTIAERENRRIEVPLVSPPPAANVVEPLAPPTPSVTPPGPVESDKRPRENTGRPRWVVPAAFAVGGLGAGGAISSALLTSEKKRTLDAVCAPGCPSSAAGDLEAFRRYRSWFFVSTAISAVGIGTAVTLLLTGDEDEDVAIRVGPSGLDVSGRF